jgi:hypothetical protein
MKRLLPLVVVAPLLLASCAGPVPTPEPTATVAECSPDTAEIAWQKSSQSMNGLVGVQIVTYSQNAEVETVESIDVPIEPFIQDADTLPTLTDSDDEQSAAWVDALLEDVQRTGQVSSAFNVNPDLGDEPRAKISDPVDGTYVVSVESPQVTVPFTITCDGVVVAESALSSLDSFGVASVAYRCGDDYGTDPTVLAALEYCPEG